MKFIPWWRVDLGQEEADKVRLLIAKRYVTQGQVAEELERRLAELLNVPYVVLTTNGSAALLTALIVLGVKAGDEVIVPDLTFVATAQAPLLLGAKVKVVEVEPKKGTIDPNKIVRAITKKTKVIIPVHLNGRAADLKKIRKLSERYKIKIVEDSAQAFYSKNSYGCLGTQSDIGIFSLGLTKLITSVQGGFLVTRNKDHFEKAKRVRSHGLLSSDFSLGFDIRGFNFKFNDLLAGIGLSQLKKVEKKAESLRYIYEFYKRETKNLNYLRIFDVDVESGEIPLWVEALCFQRDKLISILSKESIKAKAFLPTLSQLGYSKSRKKFKYSRFYANCGLILPSGPDQSQVDLDRVVRILHKKSVRKALES